MKSIKSLKKKGKLSKNLDKNRTKRISENIIKYSIYHEPKENEIEIKLIKVQENPGYNGKGKQKDKQKGKIKMENFQKVMKRKVIISKTMGKINELRKKNKKLDDKIKLLIKMRERD